jgi:hypothetical protein
MIAARWVSSLLNQPENAKAVQKGATRHAAGA